MRMRRSFGSVVSVVVALVGLLWQYSTKVLTLIEHLLTILGLSQFSGEVSAWAARHPNLPSEIGPWTLMGIGILSLAAIHIWPFVAERLKFRPLDILYDPTDPNCVRLIKSLYGPTGEFYSIRVLNQGGKTLDDVTVRALDSWFTRTIIAQAQTGLSTSVHAAVMIFRKDELHPHAPEHVQLFGLAYHPDSSSPDYILNTVQRFTLEATARDIPAIRRGFEYDPKARPMLRMLK